MATNGSEPHEIGGIRSRTPDAVIARLAKGQEGYVAARQVLADGVTRRQIESRAARGVLTRSNHRGVWSLGPPRTTPTARWWAGFLACGPESAIGRASAGAWWQVVRSEGRLVSLLVPHGARPRAGLRVHPVRALLPEDIVTSGGLRVTSLERTIVDLALDLDHGRLVSVINAAEARHQVEVAAIHRVLARTRPVAQRAKVLAALAEIASHGLTLTDSELEEVLIGLCRTYGLPLPETQVMLAGARVDAWWPGPRLALEADGYAFHKDLARFRADRALDRRRAALGITTFRYTHAELVFEGARSAAEIDAALIRLAAAANTTE